MNILVTVNDNYVEPLFVMLESLFFHEKSPMDIYMFYSDVSKENRRRLRRYIKNQGNYFAPVYVEEDVFQNAPVFRYFTKEMYYRLFCSRLIPETEERILYLDPDILIRGEISPLYEMDFQGKQIIAVEDYAINHMLTDKKKAIGFTEDDTYVNSGVLLFNLKKMRKEFVLEDFVRVLEQYSGTVSFPDQDIINLYFKNDIRLAERIYNYNTGYGSAGEILKYISGRNTEKTEPVIVHYMGKSKPWQIDYYGKYFYEYYEYLKKHLNRKEKILFIFKPCYVVAKMAKTICRKYLSPMKKEDRDK